MLDVPTESLIGGTLNETAAWKVDTQEQKNWNKTNTEMHRDDVVSESCMTEEKTRAWGEDASLMWFHILMLNNTSMCNPHSSRSYALSVSPFLMKQRCGWRHINLDPRDG